MDNVTNYIKFDTDNFDTSKGTGRVSTLERDLDIIAAPFTSDNPKAPTHQVFGKSPAGHLIPIGGIWKKTSEKDNEYYTLSIKAMNFNANLGRMAGQDDIQVQAIIPWEPKQV